MLERSQRDLRRSVRRKLALRLVAVSAPLAVVAAAAVFLTERARIGDDVLSFTVTQAALFNAEHGRVLDQLQTVESAELDAALRDFASRHQGGRLGMFDAVHLYRLNGEQVGSLVRPDTLDAEIVDGLVHSRRFPTHREPWHRLARVERTAYLLIQMPLLSSAGEPVGWMRGIFHPSESTLAAVRRRALRSAVAVAAIVLAIGAALWPVFAHLLDRLGRLSGSLLEANLGTLDALGRALAKRDGDTEEHSLRVTILSVLLAEKVGMARDGVQRLIKGAALHDVGKIAIRDEILLKPGKLTEDEYEAMKSHVDHGVDIVSRSGWLESAGEVVQYHHERFDGDGYRQGLAGRSIPLAARVFTIVDVFDALASPRPYKEAESFERTMAILEDGRGSHFDPALLDTFAEIAPEAYGRYYGESADELTEVLNGLVDRYFSGGLDSLEIA